MRADILLVPFIVKDSDGRKGFTTIRGRLSYHNKL